MSDTSGIDHSECYEKMRFYSLGCLFLDDKNQKLKAQLEVVMEALNELTTSCTHDEDDGNFRKLGDWYGWCSLCGTKVGYKKNIGRDAFKKIEEIENSTNKENK